jgi:thiosulfate/3-mercaptopyruvate sulfurtransferase
MASIVSTEWLAGQLGRGDLRLLDNRGSFAVYEQNHLPGAQFLHVETLRMSEGGMPCKMHALPVLGAIFGRLGITDDTPVVLHATRPDDHLSSSYAAWSLAVTGHRDFMVLDGHYNKWAAENRPLTQLYPVIREAQYPVRFDASIFADWRYVRDRLHDADVVLVDSRTRSLYNGTTGPTIRLGHIPGAILHNYMWDFARGGTYHTLDKLRERYVREGITPDKEIITYCITGREGSAVWFMLQCLLGYPRVRLYQASLTEWAAIPDLPMVTGNEPWGEERRAA